MTLKRERTRLKNLWNGQWVLVIDIQITSFTLLEVAEVARQCPHNGSNTLLIVQVYKI